MIRYARGPTENSSNCRIFSFSEYSRIKYVIEKNIYAHTGTKDKT